MGLLALVKTLLLATAVVAVCGSRVSEDHNSVENLSFEELNLESLGVENFSADEQLSGVDTLSDSSEPDSWTVDFVTKQGYSIETHEVTTQDGYILTLHRIPSTTGTNGRPVLLHHGFLGKSADFVVLGPKNSLGFILADQGFDVWMANARGTTNSRKHTSLTTASREYWNFSWHEVGYYDLPAEIDYILDKTGQRNLTYVGFSMGTTVFFVLGSTRPEYNDKVDKMIALGPAAFMQHVRGPVFRYIAPLIAKPAFIGSLLGNTEFLPSTRFVKWAAKKFCADNQKAQKLCKNVLFLFYGYSDPDLDGDLVERIFEYSPSGGSVKEFLHFGQLASSGGSEPVFRQYDHGYLGNLAKYKSLSPPDYPLSEISTPVHLFMGKNDWFASHQDAEVLGMLLPNTPTVKLLERETLNHFDFIYSKEINELCYNDVVRIIKEN